MIMTMVRHGRCAYFRATLATAAAITLLVVGVLLFDGTQTANGPTLEQFRARRPYASSAMVMEPAVAQKLYHFAEEEVRELLHDNDRSADNPCGNWRRQGNETCADPRQCGKGWLFLTQKVLLVIPPWTRAEGSLEKGSHLGDAINGTASELRIAYPDGGEGHTQTEWYAGEARTVTIIGLEKGKGGEESDCDSGNLSILLRLQGPEALAADAVPVPGRCAWVADFRPIIAGVYDFDATLINWKGGLEPHPFLCGEVAGQHIAGSTKMSQVRGVRFSGGFEACCALCTRAEGCVAWSATSDQDQEPLADGSSCTLFSSVSDEPPVVSEMDARLPFDEQIVHSGTPRDEEAMMYLGPSMPASRSWCSEKNSKLLAGVTEHRFAILEPSTRDEEEERVEGPSEEEPSTEKDHGRTPALITSEVFDEEHDELPTCRTTGQLPHRGRWVSLKDVKCDSTPGLVGPEGFRLYDRNVFGATLPEECYLKPATEASGIVGVLGDDPTLAMPWALSHEGYSWRPYDCLYEIMTADARESCLEERQISKFLDYGDSMINTSRQPRASVWMSKEANFLENVEPSERPRGCTLYDENEAPNTGWPMRYCGNSAKETDDADTLPQRIASYEPDVVLANWALIHRMWHHSLDEFEAFLKELGKELDSMAGRRHHHPRYMFWLSAPFLMSEREPHDTLERGRQFNAALRNLLEPRGWIEIDWMYLTQKWGPDIYDGMHYHQPATRMLAYLLMHHICHE
ncbi:unnamed protein product [Scytosiphon promiscuus]